MSFQVFGDRVLEGSSSSRSQPFPPRHSRVVHTVRPLSFARSLRTKWMITAILSVLSAIGINVFMASSAKQPSFPFDEISLFEYAKYISMTGIPGQIRGSGYFPAWSFVLAPIWWLTSSPQIFYRIAIATGVVLAVLTIIPLVFFIRRLGLATEQSVVVASIVMAMPSRSVQSAYAISEKLLFFLIVCFVVVAYRLVENSTWLRAGIFSIVLAAVVMTHTRALAILLVAVFWLLISIRKKNARIMIFCILLSSILGMAAYRFSMWFSSRLLKDPFQQGSNMRANLHSRIGVFARLIVGQSWYQIVSSFGLAVLGVLILVGLVINNLRKAKSFGVPALILGMILALFILSIMSWAYETALFPTSHFGAQIGRLDPVLYGRYVDPAMALAVAVGLSGIIGKTDKILYAASAVISLLDMAIVIIWLAPTAATWGFVTPAHIPGILPWAGSLPYRQSYLAPDVTWKWMRPTFTNDNRFWLMASATTCIFWIAYILIHRWKVTVSGVLVFACIIGSILSYPALVAFQKSDAGKTQIVEEIESIQKSYPDTKVWFDLNCRPDGFQALEQNEVVFWLQNQNFSYVRDYKDLDTGVVVACPNFAEASSTKSERISDVESQGYQLWVLPGALQKTFAERGLLQQSAVSDD